MTNIYLLSDTHFFHKNIVGWRKLNSVESMNEMMIERWNSVVKPGDTVYHGGDFAMWDAKKFNLIRPLLNGKLYLIRGNHCNAHHNAYQGVEDILAMKEFKDGQGGTLLFTHIPIHPMELKRNGGRWSANVHGHIHDHRVRWTRPVGPDPFTDNVIEIDPDYLCVSVEQTDYYPRHIDQVRAELAARKGAPTA